MSSINLCLIHKLEYPRDWGIHGHTHEFRQMFYITEGEGTFLVGGQEYRFREDYCVMIRPEEYHSMAPVKRGSVRLIDAKFFLDSPELARDLDRLPGCFRVQNTELVHLLAKVRSEWKAANSQSSGSAPYHQQLSRIYFEEFLYLLLREQSPGMPKEQASRLLDLDREYPYVTSQIINYLKENYNREFSLDDLAERLAYNKNYLCKVFKATTGYSIKRFVTLLRIQRATELICNSGKKLSDISEEVGYGDIHHFNRVYKRVIGENPSDMRDREKADIYSDILAHGEFVYRYRETPPAAGRRAGAKK